MFRTHGEPELEKKGKKDRRIEAEGHGAWCGVRKILLNLLENFDSVPLCAANQQSALEQIITLFSSFFYLVSEEVHSAPF